MVNLEKVEATPELLQAILKNLKERQAYVRDFQATGWAITAKEAVIRDIEKDIAYVEKLMQESFVPA